MALELATTASALVARGKGILAADETPGTLTKRFEALGIASTADSRRDYREMLFTSPGLADYVSGVILQDETIRQNSSRGTPFPDLLGDLGIIPGIKVDNGAKHLAGSMSETVTEGLDGLRQRLQEYSQLGARFAKWRAVIRIEGESMPSWSCIHANAHALARYAALAQEQGLVPIVEPEVLMEGSHSLSKSAAVTGKVLQAVFSELFDQGVGLEGMLLKPSMVIPGSASAEQASVGEVATATLTCLLRHVPAAVPGIVFLSGGQSARLASEHLDAMSRLPLPKPWTLTFSYGRALQDPALEAWRGKKECATAGALALLHRARCNGAAAVGGYTPAMEEQPGSVKAPEPQQILLDN